MTSISLRKTSFEKFGGAIIFAVIILYSICLDVSVAAAQESVGIYNNGRFPGQYLKWNGHPILLIGDSVTQGWMELGFNFNQEGYIDALADSGINLVMIWSYIGTNASHQIKDPRIGYDAPEVWPWQGSSDTKNFDLTRLNPIYFSRLEDFVSHAAKKKMVVLITIHDGWAKDRFAMHPFNASLGNGPLKWKHQYVELADYSHEVSGDYNPNWDWKHKNQYFQEQFCKKIIATLKHHPNVIYEMFNEGEWYNPEARRRHESHFLAFFRSRCSNLLVTNTDHIRGDHPHTDAKVDIISLHGKWENRFTDFQKGFNSRPAKSYLMSETVPGFEGHQGDINPLRRFAWETAIAGSGWVNQNDTSFGWDPNTIMNKKSAMRDKAYYFTGNCAKFFNESGIEFWNMRPNGDICSSGVCSANDGVEYIAYSSNGDSIDVNLSETAGSFDVRWYNPRDGKFIYNLKTVGGENKNFKKPDSEDWVLHLKK